MDRAESRDDLVANEVVEGFSCKRAAMPGQAASIILMNRYLQGFMDPEVSVLEVHKLLYFM